MGVYGYNYNPGISRFVDYTESGYQYTTGDKIGKLIFTNDDDFVFYNHDGTETRLSNLRASNGINKVEVTVSAAELLSGVTKTILTTPATGYTYAIHSVIMTFNHNTTAYTTSGSFKIQGTNNGSASVLYTASSDYLTNLGYSITAHLDSSSGRYCDQNSGLDLVVPALATGDGTLKLILYYSINTVT